MELPPPACPNDGACIMIMPTLDDHARRLTEHDRSLEKIGEDVRSTKEEVHVIKVVLNERQNVIGFLRSVFLAILAVGVVQVGATIWWASTLNATVTQLVQKVADHEVRLRSHEGREQKQDYRIWENEKLRQ